MPPIPPILACWTAADVQTIFRAVASQPALDFAPDHLLGPMICNGVWRDLIGDWHMYTEGGDATRVLTSYTGAPRWAVSTVHASRWAFVARTLGHWSLLPDEVILMIASCTRTGEGGYYAGNLRGPWSGQLLEQGGNGNTYGTDCGWALSFNGTPGGNTGIGFANYSDTSRTSPNSDTASNGTSNVEGLGYLPFFLGNDASGGKSYLRGSAAKWQIEEAADPVGGNYASTDGYAAIGRTDYGAVGNFTSQATATCVLLAHFSGAAARNLHTHGATIAAGIGATL